MRKLLFAIVALAFIGCNRPSLKKECEIDLSLIKNVKMQADSFGKVLFLRDSAKGMEFLRRLNNNDDKDLLFFNSEEVKTNLIYDTANGHLYEKANEAFLNAKLFKNEFLKNVFLLPIDERDSLLDIYRKIWVNL